jgi:branched-subunit amino acid aminotransferase/4-amino-4-deoxychorismate lyase
MNSLCFINGKIVRKSHARIGVDDLGLQRGYAVFDYVRTYNAKLFHFPDYLERLRKSASALHLELPYSDEKLVEITTRLIGESDLKNPAIRLILTGGRAQEPISFDQPNLIIITEELPYHPSELYKNGGKLVTLEYQRELPHVKTTNYLNSIRLESLKREKGAFNMLYYHQNRVTECPRDNFFIFLGDTLITPKDDVLRGITRKQILHLSREHFSVEEREVSLQESSSADEAFTTSTSKGVIPIVQIDDHKIGSGSAGERTKTIMRLFQDYIESYSNP